MSNLDYNRLSRQRRNWSTRVTSAVSKRRVDAGLFSPAPNRISRLLSGKRRRTVPGTPVISPPGPASTPGPPMICSSGAKLRLKRCSPQPMRWE